MRRLIVNADDFGMSDGVNEGVARGHEEGIVTSASLMVRRHAAVSAARYARSHPELSVGLHVDLGEWLFDGSNWQARDIVSAPVEVAIEAQLQRFRELVGHDPTHLDSHQHVHRGEPVASATKAIALRLGVPLRDVDPRVRYVGNFYGQTGRGEPLPDAISIDAMLRLVSAIGEGVTELGCHPATKPDMDSTYGSERIVELQALCDTRVRVRLDVELVRLCSFADVLPSEVSRANN